MTKNNDYPVSYYGGMTMTHDGDKTLYWMYTSKWEFATGYDSNGLIENYDGPEPPHPSVSERNLEMVGRAEGAEIKWTVREKNESD